jgi:predicted nucleic-acid-binding protein
MIGVDTNVLVRYIVQDDIEQSKDATRFIEKRISSSNPGFINQIVLCELVWVLKRAYRYEKTIIFNVLKKILQTKEFVVDNADIVWIALGEYQKGEADFSDYLIASYNRYSDCTHTVTFDQIASNAKYFKLLSGK